VRHREKLQDQLGRIESVTGAYELLDQLLVEAGAEQVQQILMPVDVAVQAGGGHADGAGHRAHVDLLALPDEVPGGNQDLVAGLRPNSFPSCRYGYITSGVDSGHTSHHSEHRSP